LSHSWSFCVQRKFRVNPIPGGPIPFNFNPFSKFAHSPIRDLFCIQREFRAINQLRNGYSFVIILLNISTIFDNDKQTGVGVFMNMNVGTGLSRASDSIEAGKEAATAAIAHLNGQTPALVLVFTSPKYDLERLISTIRSITGDCLLIGSTTSGEIVQGHHLDIGAGVGVLAMTAGSYRFGIASVGQARGDLDLAGQTIARESKNLAGPSPYAAILVLADAMLGNLQELMQGVYRITGPGVPIVGGAAGDDQKFVCPYVFHNDRIIKEGVVALWIASDHPLQAVTRHGWKPIGIPLLVTRTQGTQIIELDGRPAAEVYEEQLGLPLNELTPENFWNTSIMHPFGLLQSDGTAVIRVARSKTAEGVLNIQGCVPPTGSAVQVMTGSVSSLLNIVEEVATQSMKGMEEPGVLLAFSCAAREMIFRERKPEEAQRLQNAAGEIPTFGLYCCGEFARTAGVMATHNATLTAITL
jgi:hypothetical protein